MQRFAWISCVLLLGSVWIGFSMVGAPASYDLDVRVSFDNGTFVGTETVIYMNESPHVLTEIFFRLFPNAPTIYGSAFLQIETASVDDVPSEVALFLEDTVAAVPLPTPLQPGQTTSVRLEFWGQAAIWSSGASSNASSSGYGILTKTTDALTLTSFYPLVAPYSAEGWSLDPVFAYGDALMAEVADYRVRLAVNETNVFPVATGTQESTQSEEMGTVYSFDAPSIRDFAAVLLARHIEESIQTEGYTIRSWYLPEHQEAALLSTEYAAFSYELFQDLLGGAPTQKVELIEVPLRHAAGVEFDGLILVGSSYAASPQQQFFPIIISHEMAHQWFYAGVGSDPIEHPWLDEGPATYLSNVFLAEYFGERVAAAERDSWPILSNEAPSSYPSLSISSPIYEFQDSPTYARYVYSGAAAFLYELKEMIGADAFVGALRSYFADFENQIATPEDFFQAVENACGCSLSDLLLAYNILR